MRPRCSVEGAPGPRSVLDIFLSANRSRQTGSPGIGWGHGREVAGVEGHAEAVVVPVAIAVGDAPGQCDHPVRGFGAANVRAGACEERQERTPPSAQGAAKAGDLWDRIGVRRVDDLLGDPPPPVRSYL